MMTGDQTTTEDDRSARNRSTKRLSRRSVVGGIVTASLPTVAGCSSVTSLFGGEPGDVTVFNKTDSDVEATVEIVQRSDETTVLSETASIKSSEAAKYDDVFDAAAEYEFHVKTGGGLSNTNQWDLPSTDHYLYVIIHGDSIEFKQMTP